MARSANPSNNHMAQEELILQSLFRIESKIGSLDAKVEGQSSDNAKRDLRLDAHAKRIENIETYHTTSKARTGIIAIMVSGGVTFLGWLAKIVIETHSRT